MLNSPTSKLRTPRAGLFRWISSSKRTSTPPSLSWRMHLQGQHNRLASIDYWNKLAPGYDSLYSSVWSRLEDERVRLWLRTLCLPTRPTVLDIGCGTGLGLRQLIAAGVHCRYFGVDISPEMISRFQIPSSYDMSVSLATTDIADYDWKDSSRPNLIMSIYGSLNFCARRWNVIQRLASFQSSGDSIFLMFLSRYSLRRLIRAQFSSVGTYRTRKSSLPYSLEVFYDRPAHIRAQLKYLGYRVQILGDGPATGIYEIPKLWGLNTMMGKISTFMSHTIIAIGEKE